ncbi:hypothetical protein [Simiduia aestuariiviva]|uniref:Chromosome segregation ATPase n=1 Tax=Simiduia aestuariiviva TaxID=1510459 RepID=A0A839UU66_9GAMM|nr:hypothetical protein [Simiduia aestuariiviva]MBB3168917.1 chromosome segregation ATPase [Simiduia aestuariiviva]
MSDLFYIVIIAELLFVCALCGYMVYRLKRRLTRLAKRLNPSIAGASEETQTDVSVISYFVGQLKRTRALSETELGKELNLSPLITSVRCAYLNAERRALKNPENSKDYWLALKEEIDKLIGILSTEAKRTGKENTALRQKLKLLKDRLEKLGDKDWADQNSVLEGEITKPPGYVLRFARDVDVTHQSAKKATGSGIELFDQLEKQKQHTQNLTMMIKEGKNTGDLEQRVAEYERMLYKMEHESASLQKALRDAQKKLNQVDEAFNSVPVSERQSETLLSVIRANKDSDDSSSNIFDDLVADTQNIGTQSRKNLDGLQKTIFDQRKSILSMENTIAALEAELTGDSAEDDAKRTELEKLKRALMESEGCIKILEDEVDNLHTHLKELQVQREELQEQYQNQSDEEILENLSSEFEAQANAQETGLLANNSSAEFLTEFMINAIESGSLEDLITVLQHAVSEMSFQSLIRVMVGTNKVDIAAMGKLTKEDKLLIEHLNFEPDLPIKDVGKHITLHFRNVRAILKHQDRAKPLTQNQRQVLTQVFSFASSLAEKVALQKGMKKRLTNYEQLNDMMQTISKNLDAQYKYQKDETVSIIQSIVDQSHMLAGEKVTPGQQQVLKAMEDEAMQRTELLEANRAIVRKQFNKIMERLTSMTKE